MSEYRFKPRKQNIVLKVEREGEDGEIESKDLVFSCVATNFSFVKRLIDMVDQISALSTGSITDKSIVSVVETEKAVFEAIAPGKWDEFFEYLGEDIGYMTELVGLMVNTVKEKAFDGKRSEIEPEVPGGEEV